MVKFDFHFTHFPETSKNRVLEYGSTNKHHGFYFNFTKNILFYDENWVSSFRRVGECLNQGKRCIWLVSCSVFVQGRVMKGLGAGNNRYEASNIASYRLYLLLKEFGPSFLMPKYVIGYPNVRGHCFLISVVLALMNSYAFLDVLLAVNMDITLTRNTNKQVEKRGYNLTETKMYWSSLLFSIHRRYFKLSKAGICTSSDLRVIYKRSIRGVSPSFDPIYKARGSNRAELDLDQDLVRRLCSSMRSFCDERYFNKGGDERKAYQDLLFKLGAEDERFINEFFLKIRVNYSCGRCVGGPFINIYKVPMLISNGLFDYQYILNNIDKVVKSTDLRCTRSTNFGTCGGKIRHVFRCQVLNLPRLICFTQTVDKCDFLLPEELVLKPLIGSRTYGRLSSSNRYKCYKDKEGNSYGDVYREPLETDVFDGWHTYPSLFTKRGFVDVNNNKISEVGPLFGKITPCSVHIYQSANDMNCLTDRRLF